jgi:NAD(P)-dependent dehydrogenase (short-subunit alcohol dehydrogenase family)
MARLAGKVALITGGNSGIGFATARAFLAEGARVVITGRNPETLEKARRDLGESVVTFAGDVADLKKLDELFALIKDRFGGLDIIFANAGVGAHTPLGGTSEETFDHVFDVNVKGVFFTVQKALPLLRDGASIILNASVGIYRGWPGAGVYAASKGAVRVFARNFSAELASRRIRVNAVSPGPIETPMWGRGGIDAKEVKARQQRMQQGAPLDRLGRPEEIASTVVFLASDESSYVVGVEILVDGGVKELPAGAPVYR